MSDDIYLKRNVYGYDVDDLSSKVEQNLLGQISFSKILIPRYFRVLHNHLIISKDMIDRCLHYVNSLEVSRAKMDANHYHDTSTLKNIKWYLPTASNAKTIFFIKLYKSRTRQINNKLLQDYRTSSYTRMN